MNEIILPDYKGESIVNLMSSIGESFNGKMEYVNHKLISSNELKKYKNVILLVIDGLGYNYLIEKKDSFLYKNIRGRMSSVFLPTTAAALTTLTTGVAPQQHALTGWFVFLKEIGILSMILPFLPRIGGEVFNNKGYDMKDIVGSKSFTSKIKAESYSLLPDYLITGSYTKAMAIKSKILGYKTNSFDSLFNTINKIVHKKSNKRKYLYAYWDRLDGLGHKFGVNSKKHNSHFYNIDKKIKKLANKLKGTNSCLLITADHGQMNSSGETIIKLENHPKLKECLTMPLSGEGRVCYCYVHPSKAKDFENYVKTKMSNYCWIFKSEELIKKNFFGLGEVNPNLFDRVGDYILIMKKNYLLKDNIEFKKKEHIGHHAGVSADEMYVPLIVID